MTPSPRPVVRLPPSWAPLQWQVLGSAGLREESCSELRSSLLIAFTRCLRMDGDGEPRIAVTEADLRGLHIDPFEQERRGIRSTKIVGANSR